MLRLLTLDDPMGLPLFFYGSLRDDLILEVVIGRPVDALDADPAWLDGYRTERAQNYTFPLLMPAPGSAAEGRLVYGLTEEDRRRIAYFEDSEYRMARHTVRHAAGSAQAGVFQGSERLASSGTAWDLLAFQANDRDLLLAVTRHVMQRHYGITPQTQIEEQWPAIRDQIARSMGLA
jgi:hypothetical protein